MVGGDAGAFQETIACHASDCIGRAEGVALMAGKVGMRDKLFKSPVMVEKFRASIRVGLIRNRLMNHLLGKLEMTPTQLKAAEILLNKCVPSMASMEHSGEVQHSFVAGLPEVTKSTEEWKQHYAPTQTIQ